MRNYAVSILALLALIAAGCNPVEMEETRVYVRGRIWADSMHTQGAEGIGVFTTGPGEGSTQETYMASTNHNGDFAFDIQMYPSEYEQEGGSGLAGFLSFGVRAIYGTKVYYYGGDEDVIFNVMGGDTLYLYDIDLDMFETGGGS